MYSKELSIYLPAAGGKPANGMANGESDDPNPKIVYSFKKY